MEDVVSFEVAKLLKEIGFKELSSWYYYPSAFINDKGKPRLIADGINDDVNNTYYDGLNFNNSLFIDNYNDYISYYSAPTQSLAQKFLREKYWLIINIKHKPTSQTYGYSITSKYDKDNDYIVNKLYHKFETYESALEDALFTCLSKNENGEFVYIKLEK